MTFPPTSIELPSHLLAWLADLAQTQSGASVTGPGPAALASLAGALPGHIEATVLREAPSEDMDRRQWLLQLQTIGLAIQGCSGLDPAAFPWAPALALALTGALDARKLASKALPEEPSLEPSEDPGEDDASDADSDPLEEAWRSIATLRRLTRLSSWEEARDLPIALEIAKKLANEPWQSAIRQARRELEGDGDGDVEERRIRWVAYGLEARLRLEAIAAELLAPELFDALEAIDTSLDQEGPALALLPEQDYQEIASFGGFPQGWASWRNEQAARPLDLSLQQALVAWGQQKQAEGRAVQAAEAAAHQAAPQHLDPLAHALQWLGAQARLGVLEAPHATPFHAAPVAAPAPRVAQAATDDNTRLLHDLLHASQAEQNEKLDRLYASLRRSPCCWLRRDLRQAADALAASPRTGELVPEILRRMRPAPGITPLLVAIEGTSVGDVWQLRVSRRPEPGDPWEKAGVLQKVARDAVRLAFGVAAEQMPHSLPPAPFEEHSIELIGGGHLGIEAIDGNSLGLAAALAFVSLWLDRSLPEDLACAAALRADGSTRAVGYLPAKSSALAQLAGPATRLLLAPQATPVEAVTPVVVRSLREAMREAGLESIDAQTYRPWMPGEADRLDLLARYHTHVERQALGDYAGRGLDPWLVLGDRIRLLVRSLGTASDVASRQVITQGKIDAILAFTHGLDDASAGELLHDLDLTKVQPVIAVFARIVELGHVIDACSEGRRSWDEANGLASALEGALSSLSGPDHDLFEGRVFGTIGRVWLHQRKLSEATRWLRQSVDSHDAHLWTEAGRSRIYLATALRMDGQFEEAARTLEAAIPLLDRCQQRKPSYAEQTKLFWGYELARLLLEINRPRDAVAAIEVRLHQARQLGPWPLAGMLRTLAWAHQAPDDRARTLAELERAAGENPLLRKIFQEASGPFRRDGEVY